MSYQIRLAESSDSKSILDIYAPFIRDTSVSFEADVPSEKEFASRIEAVLAEAPWLVCLADTQIVGFAYAGKHRVREAYRWTRELSVYVQADSRKLGVATALYSTLIPLLQLQGYANALAGVTLPNPASVRFHEQIGFKPIGVYHKVGIKQGQFHDVGWWEMHLHEGIPKRIRDLDELKGTEAWKSAFEAGISVLGMSSGGEQSSL